MEPIERIEAGSAPQGQSRIVYALVSLLLLAPCYWQPRLNAGDLSNSIYNGWLAGLVESGRSQGLLIVNRWTNVVFDFILRGLFRTLGAEAAQRITVSIAVLTFIWGAFAFVSVVSGRRPWHFLPSFAMLAYGWVFHMGFFDFYLSLGLCFWAMAIAWELKPWRVAAATPIFLLAYLSHTLPVFWTLGLLSYVFLARPLAPRNRAFLTANFVLGMAVLHLFVGRAMFVQTSSGPPAMTSGLEHAWMFGSQYYIVFMGLAAVWGALFLALIRHTGARQVVDSIPFQVCLVGAAGVFALPITMLIPNFFHSLSYVGERMALGLAVCLCALVGTVRPRLVERCAIFAVALAFFTLVYRDERAVNSLEDQMQNVVARAGNTRVFKPAIERFGYPAK